MGCGVQPMQGLGIKIHEFQGGGRGMSAHKYLSLWNLPITLFHDVMPAYVNHKNITYIVYQKNLVICKMDPL